MIRAPATHTAPAPLLDNMLLVEQVRIVLVGLSPRNSKRYLSSLLWGDRVAHVAPEGPASGTCEGIGFSKQVPYP